ncbi:hypothetical protein C8259_24905 [Nocardia nova]|uniref:Uncharacterized protein n=1 Tax=Nocardia nova TaxID=37330 RepID=A0A2T2YWI7_9NOCA|nr:hypothetical protein C8259_24905 [Nocardia nova]
MRVADPDRAEQNPVHVLVLAGIDPHHLLDDPEDRGRVTVPGPLSRSPTVTSRSAGVSEATTSARRPSTAIESIVHPRAVQVVSRSRNTPAPALLAGHRVAALGRTAPVTMN